MYSTFPLYSFQRWLMVQKLHVCSVCLWDGSEEASSSLSSSPLFSEPSLMKLQLLPPWTVFQLNSERRPIRHYWFSSWPDHHIPECIVSLLKLVEEVETHRKSLEPITDAVPGNGPIIVHCRLVFMKKKALTSSLLQNKHILDSVLRSFKALFICWRTTVNLQTQN